MVDRSLNTLNDNDKCSGNFSRHQQHRGRNDRYNGGYNNRPRGRGRTFYFRNAQHPASHNPGFNVNGQKSLNEGFSGNKDENKDENGPESSCQDRHVNPRSRAYGEKSNANVSFHNSWEKRNGCTRNYNKPCKYSLSRQQDTMSPSRELDHSNAPVSSTSESTPLSPSSCSDNALISAAAAFSPTLCEADDCSQQGSSKKNVWTERMEFYHSAQPKNEEEEDLMMKRALEESQKLEEERQRQILEETTSRVHILSVKEDVEIEVPGEVEPEVKSPVSELSVALSASSPVHVEGIPATDLPVLPSDSHESLTSSDDFRSPSVPDPGMPSIGGAGIVESTVLHISCESDEHQPPCGRVEFCQSDVSAFTSVTRAKCVPLPAVVKGCDQRLRNSYDNRVTENGSAGIVSCAISSSHSLAAIRSKPVIKNGPVSLSPDYEVVSPSCGSQLSDAEEDVAQPVNACAEVPESFTGSPPLECGVALSPETDNSSMPAISYALSGICENTDGEHRERLMGCYQAPIPMPVPGVPSIPPCFQSPLPGMMYQYPPSVPPYMLPMASCYSSGVSVIPYSPYHMMPPPPPGYIPSVRMVPITYPPVPHPSAPYYIPPSAICHPVPTPLSTPMQPSPQR